ncbi:MAG: hypothetical protein HYY08_03635 [Firmicutes bacterium]|nr:hypothetical protein [Bacillota bacterium]
MLESPERPRVGLLLLTANFWESNGQTTGEGRYKELPGWIEDDAASVRQVLGKELDIVGGGVIRNPAQARAAARRIRVEDVDALVICHLMWAEDQVLIAALDGLSSLPMIVWCYSPFESLPDHIKISQLFRSSGAVGTVQCSSILNSLSSRYGFVCGSHSEDGVADAIVRYARAARLAKDLRQVRIGIVPHRCESMGCTFVDEEALRRHLGPTLCYSSVARLAELSELVPEPEVNEYVQSLTDRYPVREVGTESLARAARVSLGMARLIEDDDLAALCINDLNHELHQVLGCRPCLYHPRLGERRRVITMEADVAAALAMLILNRLGPQPAMYTEPFTFDKQSNTVVFGHCGPSDTRLAGEAGVTITPDYEYENVDRYQGAWLEFMGKPGRVSLLNHTYHGGDFRLAATRGESLGGANKLEGFPHVHVRPDVTVERFFREAVRLGTSQHWAIGYGDFVPAIVELAGILDVPVEVIE